MTLTVKIDHDTWEEIVPWLLSNVGRCGVNWTYDNHWLWVKVHFAKVDDYTLFCLRWG